MAGRTVLAMPPGHGHGAFGPGPAVHAGHGHGHVHGGGAFGGGASAGVDACGGACAGCGLAACGCGDAGAATMAYVGGGQGCYVQETSYKFVGQGAGEFRYLSVPRSYSCVLLSCGGCLLGLLLLALLLSFFPWPMTTTTTPPVVGPPGYCLLWGDPHVETFDHTFPSFYSEGEYWIVRSATVYIQGRYLATPFTHGLAATFAVAMGGPFLRGHRLIVGALQGGQITWDGRPILQSFPSEFHDTEGLVKASYNGVGQVVDPANEHMEKRIVHLDLPWGVHVQVLRWENYINVRITMAPRVGGQDGHCGNFNGDPADDSKDLIKSRIGQRVSGSDLLFHTQAQVVSGAKKLTLDDCPREQKEQAARACRGARPEEGKTAFGGKPLEDCMFDVCFGGKAFAEEDGVAESEVV